MALKTKLPEAIYIDTSDALRQMMATIQGQSELAIDTESNNMYAYHGQVCLIQLSTRQQDYIIDPLQLDDIQVLGSLFADESIEKIFHAAEYDLICLKRDYDFDVHNLFDTMSAARLLGAKKFGLGDLLHQHFGVKVDKSHQRDDWGKRPLPKDSLIYAQMDTHFLHELRDTYHQQLVERNQMAEAREIFGDVLRFEIKDRTFDPQGFWKIGRPSRLNRRQMALLKELYILRDDLAKEEDKPPFKVLSNKTLVNIARKQPLNYPSLLKIRGINNRVLNHYGEDILEAVSRGRSGKPPKQPPRDEPDAALSERYIALHAWRKQRAKARGIDSSLIVAKQTLWQLASEMPQSEDELAQIDGFGAWRMEEYGDDVLTIISSLR